MVEKEVYWGYGDGEKIEITIVELLGIFIFIFVLFLTMKASIGFSLMFIFFVCFEIYRALTIPEKNRKNRKVIKFGFILLMIFTVFYFLDVFSTYLAVHKLGIAFELNQTIVSLWETHGYLKGELIRLAYIIFPYIIFPALSLIFFRRKTTQIFTLSFLLLLILSFGIVLVNNFSILFIYYLS